MSKKKSRTLKTKNTFNWNLLIFQFFCFSVTGWIFEVLLNVYYRAPFENRGFLYGPYLPVYGVGGLILILALFGLMQKKIKWGKINITPVVVFALIAILTTILELITGLVMENLFGRRWWDYSDYWLNYRGHIAPLASLRFGVLGVVFLYFVNSPLEKFFNKFSPKQQAWLAKIIGICLVVDLMVTLLFRM